jgi:endonuclease YncB( thermonuclease family)
MYSHTRRVLCRSLLAAALIPRLARAEENLPVSGLVSEVIDGDTLRLADGREIRLVCIQAPKIRLGDRGQDWPFGQEARRYLGALCKDKEVFLHFAGTPRDRYDRLLAQVFCRRVSPGRGRPVGGGEQGGLMMKSSQPFGDGIWVQGLMVSAGLARVYSFADNRAYAADLLKIEEKARTHHARLWGHPAYAVRRATDLAGLGRLIGRFELVQGAVFAAKQVKGRFYLNFGPDYRKDFTVTIEERNRKLFTMESDPAKLTGKELRVRGWLSWRNGPSIEATHPEQLEILS